MPNRTIPVQWELSTDERFRRIERRGTAAARPDTAHSVHNELGGLRPGRDYWYRFRAEGHISPVGRTRTAPHPATHGPALIMAFASCSQYEHGYFTAYRRLAEQHPDLVLHLGDYQYENKKGVCNSPGGNVRDHEGPVTVTLANYRQRHAQYKADPDLQAAHRAAPWLVVFDDHEIENNWASDTPAPEAFRARRAAAFRAYYENMPLRRRSLPEGPGMQLYRRIGGDGSRTSTCSTPGSSATTRPAATATRTAPRPPTPPAPSPATGRRPGSSTASAAPAHAGTSSASRCSSPSATTPKTPTPPTTPTSRSTRTCASTTTSAAT